MKPSLLNKLNWLLAACLVVTFQMPRAVRADPPEIGAGWLVMRSLHSATYKGVTSTGELEATTEINVGTRKGEMTYPLGSIHVEFKLPMFHPTDPKEIKLSRLSMVQQFAKWEEEGFDMSKIPENVTLTYSSSAARGGTKKKALLKTICESHSSAVKNGQDFFLLQDPKSGDYRFKPIIGSEAPKRRQASVPEFGNDMQPARMLKIKPTETLSPLELRQSAFGIYKAITDPKTSPTEVREAALLSGELALKLKKSVEEHASDYSVAVGEWQNSEFGEKIKSGDVKIEEVVNYAKQINAELNMTDAAILAANAPELGAKLKNPKLKPEDIAHIKLELGLLRTLYRNILKSKQTATKLEQLLNEPEAYLRAQSNSRITTLAQDLLREKTEKALAEVKEGPESPQYAQLKRELLMKRGTEMKAQREIATQQIEAWVQKQLAYWKQPGVVDRIHLLLGALDKLTKNGRARLDRTPETIQGERPSIWSYPEQLALMEKHATTLEDLAKMAGDRAFDPRIAPPEPNKESSEVIRVKKAMDLEDLGRATVVPLTEAHLPIVLPAHCLGRVRNFLP